MGTIEAKDKFIPSLMFFYHRIYLNGKQIFLKDENLENLGKNLDEIDIKSIENDLPKLFIDQNIRKIFGKLLPEDSELLNAEEIEKHIIPEKDP